MSAVFLVVGSKGGAGATTLSVEFAKTAIRLGMPATVVDADLYRPAYAIDPAQCGRDCSTLSARARSTRSRASGIVNVVELLDKYESIFALKDERHRNRSRRRPRPVTASSSSMLRARSTSSCGRSSSSRRTYCSSSNRTCSERLRGAAPDRRFCTLRYSARLHFRRHQSALRPLRRYPSANSNVRSGASVIGESSEDRSTAVTAKSVETIVKRSARVSTGRAVRRALELALLYPCRRSSYVYERARLDGADEDTAIRGEAARAPRRFGKPAPERTALSNSKLEISSEVTRRVDVVAASRAHYGRPESSPNYANRSVIRSTPCSQTVTTSTCKNAPNCNKRSSTNNSDSGRSKTSCETSACRKSW